MSLMNGRDLISKEINRSIPSFDVGGGNLEFIRAAFEASDLAGGSIFLSSTPSTINSYLGYNKYVEVIKLISQDYESNYAIHLDHANEIDDVVLALKSGFTSVMYDGSDLTIEENISNTIQLLSVTKSFDASLEAEIGIIGGKEDEIQSDKSILPSLDDVMFFLNETKVDLMAPAVGTVHGYFKGEPKIDYDLVNSLPFNKYYFVLHGCTGLDFKLINEMSKKGFVKFNFATTLRKVYRDAINEALNTQTSSEKPYLLVNHAKEMLKNYMVEIFKALND